MSENQKKISNIYTIRIKGHLEDHWRDWFKGLTFTHESDGTTTLHGPLPDDAALHGILNSIRDLNLKLISVSHDEHLSEDLQNET